ncbi:hypothetical protein AB6A40_004394 [Gnathostoma spinigerum]|uniref:Uncharacterized protein n=1 Tax=Gnathostoma spinigerum TaxID=75299 RepID=A0ABD6EN18_9BILA
MTVSTVDERTTTDLGREWKLEGRFLTFFLFGGVKKTIRRERSQRRTENEKEMSPQSVSLLFRTKICVRKIKSKPKGHIETTDSVAYSCNRISYDAMPNLDFIQLAHRTYTQQFDFNVTEYHQPNNGDIIAAQSIFSVDC